MGNDQVRSGRNSFLNHFSSRHKSCNDTRDFHIRIPIGKNVACREDMPSSSYGIQDQVACVFQNGIQRSPASFMLSSQSSFAFSST